MSIRDGLRLLMSAPASFVRDNRGATAVIFALLLPLLAGMGAMAIDVGIWTVQKRQAQGAADQAAYSAAVASQAGNTTAQAITQAKAITAGMGFVDGVNGVTVTVNSPPTMGSLSGQTGYWEVLIQQPQSSSLAKMILTTAPTARARAVAGGASGGNACMIALSTTGNALAFNNNSSITDPDCGIYSNSNSPTALYCGTSSGNGAPDIYANTYVVGNAAGNCDFQGNISTKLHTGQAIIADPYATQVTSAQLATMRPTSCDRTSVVTSGTIQPSTPGGTALLCGGINVSGTLTFSPGVYFVDSIFTSATSAGTTLNATGGVTFVLSSGVSFNPRNNTTLNITAPSSGTFAGIAVMSLATSPASHDPSGNNLQFNITGALYFPNQALNIDNNFSTSMCTQLVAKTISVKNNAAMYHLCAGSGIRTIGGSTMALLE